MKKLYVIILSFIIIASLNAEDKNLDENLLQKLKKIYSFDNEKKSKNIPFVYYINEAGIMVGDFYYNLDMFKNETRFTNIGLWSPTTDTFLIWANMSNYPINGKLTGGLKIQIMKYNDIRNTAMGNDSSSDEIPKEYLHILDEYKEMSDEQKEKIGYASATGDYSQLDTEELNMLQDLGTIDKSTLDGYRLYHGWNNVVGANINYAINENNNIKLEYDYNYLESQIKTYKSDALSMAYEYSDTNDIHNPSSGKRLILNVKKSLNMLGKDSENEWDYYKLTFDIRKYIPVFKKSIFALRFRTQSTGGKKVLSEERTSLRRFMTGNADDKVETYAPFFDNALLGDLETFRGYYYYRFHDNHSVLLQAELRFPLDKFISGMQGTIFAEVGRVSDTYDTEMFYKDMHYSGGVGFRYFFNKQMLVRSDVGFSNEAINVRMNTGQAY